MPPDTQQSIFDVVRDTAERSPERLAVIVGDAETRTYGELMVGVRRLMHAFGELGLRQGDRLALCLPNCPEWIETFIAALGAGLVIVPSNPSWTPTEIAFLLEHSGAGAVVCSADSAQAIEALRQRIESFETVIAVGRTAVKGVVAYDSLLEAGRPERGDTSEVRAEDRAMVVYTSGTSSGRPKGVITSHRLLLNDIGLAYAAVMDATPVDRCMLVTPLFHNNALGACLSALAVGASVLFPRRFSASGFWPLVDTYRPTYLFTMAPIVNILMAAPPTSIEQNHGMRALFVLGAGQRATEIEARFAAPVIDCYGMSECPCGTVTRLGEPHRPGSAGRAFPHVELRILRPDGSAAESDEAGEVVFRHGRIFDGYLDDPAETNRAVRDGWFHTGDIGRLDADGFFYFVDREKDLIRRGGENVSSQEVEAQLRTHATVAEVAAIAVPDPVLGERVAAVVVPVAGQEPTLEELRRHARTALAEYKLPEFLVVRDELPRTENGKIQKFVLRRELAPVLAKQEA